MGIFKFNRYTCIDKCKYALVKANEQMIISGARLTWFTERLEALDDNKLQTLEAILFSNVFAKKELLFEFFLQINKETTAEYFENNC